MKREEKTDALKRLEERKLTLLAIMAESDAHAAKCVKLGLEFANEYPDEYAAYEAAREEYNAIEVEASDVEAQEVDEEPIVPAQHEPDEENS